MRYAMKIRAAGLNARMAAIGPSPVLELRSGAPPASIDMGASGELLASLKLPAVWIAPTSGAAVEKSGEWVGMGAKRGQIGHFRLCSSDGVAVLDGTVSGLDGDGEAIVDNTNVELRQSVSVEYFSITTGNG